MSCPSTPSSAPTAPRNPPKPPRATPPRLRPAPPSSPTPSTAPKPNRPGSSPPTPGKTPAPTPPGGLPDLADPAWLTASEPAPPVTGCDNPLLASQFDAITIGDQTAAARRRPGPGRPALGPRDRLQLPAVKRPDQPRNRSRTRNPPGTGAQRHHRQAPRRAQHLALLGRRPRRLLRPGLRPGGRPGPLRQHQTGHLPGLFDNRHRRRHLAAARPPRPDRRPRDRPRTDRRHRLPAEAPPRRPADRRRQPGRQVPPPDPARERRRRGQLQAPGSGHRRPQHRPADHRSSPKTRSCPPAASTVNLKEGPRAPLASPTSCGSFETTSDLVPWSHAGNPRRPSDGQLQRRLGSERHRLPGQPGKPAPSPRRSSAPAPNQRRRPAASPFTLHIARARRRTGTELLGSDPAQGPGRQVHRRPLLL